MKFTYDTYSFSCGDKNPLGLRLKHVKEGDKFVTTFMPEERYQGYPGKLHGGIITTILDDVMSRCVNEMGLIGFTARLEVRFRQCIFVGQPIRAEAWVVKTRRLLIDTQSHVLTEDGTIAAEAQARFMILRDGEKLFEKLKLV